MSNIFDFPRASSLAFQDPATPIAEGIIDLHHSIFFYLLVILGGVLTIFIKMIITSIYGWEFPTIRHMEEFRKNYLNLNNLIHGTTLEIIWTITPSIILMLIAMPSFALLYSIDEVIEPELTFKVIGHQWYWSYETPGNSEIDSYMLPVSDLNIGDYRLLEADNTLVLPLDTHIRFIVTSGDVLHSLAVPSFGIKVDAVPGRLNQVSAFIKREGLFYGQCSELCGVNHGFMPIKFAVIDLKQPPTFSNVGPSNLGRALRLAALPILEGPCGVNHGFMPIKFAVIDDFWMERFFNSLCSTT